MTTMVRWNYKKQEKLTFLSGGKIPESHSYYDTDRWSLTQDVEDVWNKIQCPRSHVLLCLGTKNLPPLKEDK